MQNRVLLFRQLINSLIQGNIVATNHKIDCDIENTNLHSYPMAWDCAQKMFSFEKPTHLEALQLLRFISTMQHGVDTADLQDMVEYIEDVFKFGITLKDL